MLELFDIPLRFAIFISGAMLTVYTINSALRSFVLPRADRTYLTVLVMAIIYRLQSIGFKASKRFAAKDRILAMHPPYVMFILPLVWLTLIVIGYTGMYMALDPVLSWRDALILSGSSLMTLGASFHDSMPIILLTFTQAALSMMLIALLIGYLPTMYGAFSERELLVTKLQAFAGSPPSIAEMIHILHYVGWLDSQELMRSFWMDWQDWFLQIEEQHTTLALLNFYRSSQPDRHWVTAAGCVLDTAAVIASSVNLNGAMSAGVVLRSGFLTLRTIADYFELDYNPDPQPGDPIQVTREEFEQALDRLVELGVPVREDRDYCWDHYSGWRVNYDDVLIGLARITHAPYAMWSSDRAHTWAVDDIPVEAASVLESIRTATS